MKRSQPLKRGARREEILMATLRAILKHRPREIVKDDFAYDRLVATYRAAARAALRRAAAEK